MLLGGVEGQVERSGTYYPVEMMIGSKNKIPSAVEGPVIRDLMALAAVVYEQVGT